MANYILRKVDDALWARVKARAEKQQIPLRAMLVALLEAYASGQVSIEASNTRVVTKK